MQRRYFLSSSSSFLHNNKNSSITTTSSKLLNNIRGTMSSLRPKQEAKPDFTTVQIFKNSNNSNEDQQQAAPPRPELPPLNEESMQLYWSTRWEKSATNWQVSERKAGDDLFVKNLNSLLKRTDLKFDKFFEPSFRGIDVFVPLCGDSAVLSFLFQTGFNVTGVDIAEKPLRNVMQECMINLPQSVKVVWEEKQEGEHKVFVGRAYDSDTHQASQGDDTQKDKKSPQLATITLVCGDFFTAPLGNGRFDILYDRASHCAVVPDLRQKYAEKIYKDVLITAEKKQEKLDARKQKNKEASNSSTTVNIFDQLPPNNGTAIHFALYQRPAETQAKGPPFFFPLSDAQKYYPEEKFESEQVSFATEEEAAATPGGFMEGTAHFYQKL